MSFFTSTAAAVAAQLELPVGAQHPEQDLGHLGDASVEFSWADGVLGGMRRGVQAGGTLVTTFCLCPAKNRAVVYAWSGSVQQAKAIVFLNVAGVQRLLCHLSGGRRERSRAFVFANPSEPA